MPLDDGTSQLVADHVFRHTIANHGYGGAMGIRTPDLLNAIEALYQLSYDPLRELATIGTLVAGFKQILPRK
jgi:hypothetical protein